MLTQLTTGTVDFRTSIRLIDRVGRSALSTAEYFRDTQLRAAPLLIDNIFRCAQAGMEVFALKVRVLARTRYQPALATELAE